LNTEKNIIMGSLEAQKLTHSESTFLKKKSPAGIVLFSRNIDSSCQTPKELIETVQKHSSQQPMIISIDQEGGRVSRIKHNFPDLGASLFLAQGKSKKQNLEAIYTYAESVGNALKTRGVHLNFAPVVDVLNETSDSSIGDRCFAYTTEDVILRAGAYINGLQKAGVYACLKHFPGQGRAQADTHKKTSEITTTLADLKKIDIQPFVALLEHTDFVMISHCRFTKICTFEASRSYKWITEILRQQMGFKGIIVSDDLMMGAVGSSGKIWEEYLLESVAAGCDLLLVCSGLDKWNIALEALKRAKQKSSFFAKRIEESAQRVARFRSKL
jgi:beta-N-acetylhexosaminidase